MSGISKKGRDKSVSSRPSTPRREVNRAFQSATQVLAAVGSPYPIFQHTASGSRIIPQRFTSRPIGETHLNQGDPTGNPVDPGPLEPELGPMGHPMLNDPVLIQER
jgi:hypothetical protein